MAKKRDSWDKINRQKKVTDEPRGVGSGPSSTSGVVTHLLKRHRARLEAARQKTFTEAFSGNNYKVTFRITGSDIPKPIKPWMDENKIDERLVINAINSELGRTPILRSGIVFRFWAYCEDMESLDRQHPGSRIKPPVEFKTWLLKFVSRNNYSD